MTRTFPAAPLYTSLYSPDATYPDLGKLDVRLSWLNRLGVLRRHHRLAFPLLARAFGRLTVDAPVTLVSSSGWAHGVRTTGRKVVYCYAPARWLYQTDRYQRGACWPARLALAVGGGALRRWDQRAARTADRYLVTCNGVRDEVRRVYGIEAEVLHAPHSADVTAPRRALAGVTPGFLLAVSRLMPHKNIDAIIQAMRLLPQQRLVIVGQGPEEARLRLLAGANVQFVGPVDEAQLSWLYAETSGLVSASHEDFGLTPLEAAAFGRPSAVLRFGGFLETVVDGTTGVFFDKPEPEAIAAAVRRLVGTAWVPERISSWADRFGEEAFARRLHAVVAEETQQCGARPRAAVASGARNRGAGASAR